MAFELGFLLLKFCPVPYLSTKNKIKGLEATPVVVTGVDTLTPKSRGEPQEEKRKKKKKKKKCEEEENRKGKKPGEEEDKKRGYFLKRVPLMFWKIPPLSPPFSLPFYLFLWVLLSVARSCHLEL